MVLSKAQPAEIFCDADEVGLIVRVEINIFNKLFFLNKDGRLTHYNISIGYDYLDVKSPHDLNEREIRHVQR